MNALAALPARIRRSVAHRSRLALGRLERQLLSGFARAGIPLRKPQMILRCYRGAEGSGLFSEVRVVMGALAHYEQWRHIYAGLRVDYANLGLFHDAAHGPNWWEYYFEPIDLGSAEDAIAREVSPLKHQLFAEEGERLSRERAADLVRRHVRPRPHIARAVDAYVARYFGDAFVVGIHYRGTNKFEEAPRVPYGDVRDAVVATLRSAGPAPGRIFLATDEQAFLDYMCTQFPDGLVYREMFRSRDGRPIDVVNDDSNHKKGEDAVMDCLLLSRCQHLVRTESNLSVCSTLFNPGLPQVRLNRPYD